MFTWNETVAISLISILGDPELVIYFLSILKPLRREYLEDEAREWHQSLRISQEDRWKRISELSKRRKFSQMNASVPITCTLPFDGGMWRNSRELLRMIRYFRPGFIRYNTVVLPVLSTKDEKNSMKIKIVNLINDKDEGGCKFCMCYSFSEIQTALDDLITFEGDPEPNWDWEEYPYIRVADRNKKLSETFVQIKN